MRTVMLSGRRLWWFVVAGVGTVMVVWSVVWLILADDGDVPAPLRGSTDVSITADRERDRVSRPDGGRSGDDLGSGRPSAPSSATPTVAGDRDATEGDATDGDTADQPEPVLPDGFERVQATVTAADGTTCELCLWLAATPDQRRRGLMYVTDLGPADGMAFVYPAPRTGSFWMKNTVLPLSIAFFGPTGDHLGSFDMEPCAVDPCQRYPTAPDFVVAVETVRSGLDELGIGPGSTIDVTDLPCPD
jgi:uncharacterized membrane protein (UPF0127 family)